MLKKNLQDYLKDYLKDELSILGPKGTQDCLVSILSGKAFLGKSGFPVIETSSYDLFLNNIPHLFKNGNNFLSCAQQINEKIKKTDDLKREDSSSIERALDVLKRVTLTAAITAAPDLWVLRHLLSTLKVTRIDEKILAGGWLNIHKLSVDEKFNFDHLKNIFGFIYSRGYLDFKILDNEFYYKNLSSDLFNSCLPIPQELPCNFIPTIATYLKGKEDFEARLIDQFLEVKTSGLPAKSWVASSFEVDIGYALMPMVLALRSIDKTKELKLGKNILEQGPYYTQSMIDLLKKAGAIDKNHLVTAIGERIFLRGPGPYGIIHAYYPYMDKHIELLNNKPEEKIWVARGENVAASQDANAKSFQKINDSIDQFSKDTGFELKVFIEHAVGYGEASRQRFQRSGEKGIQYFGADLEQSAIEKAMEGQREGKLPKNMKFIGNADIGRPEILINEVQKHGLSLSNSIMVVGNGFHEVRDQTNEKMISIFESYAKAGILIVFTEESGLQDEDLLQTGWNTYHAGFKYVHHISGQGLRPAIDKDGDLGKKFSWKKCAELAGHEVLEQYTTRTRSIFPHRKDGYNPSISVNYFCVPRNGVKKT